MLLRRTRVRLLAYWNQFRASFWFLPAWFVLSAIVVAFLFPRFDTLISDWTDEYVGWLQISPASAEATLSMVATTMITVSCVVFSITVVSLSIVSSQFGSRIIRTMMTDQVTQSTIGVFLGTAVYCFLLPRLTNLFADDPTVPRLSVSVAILLALVAIGVLIHFIHHVAITIQAPSVIKRLSHDLDAAINTVYTEVRVDHPAQEDRADHPGEQQMEWTLEPEELRATVDGYFQAIETEALIDLASRHDVVIELLPRVGSFIARGDLLAHLRTREPLDEAFHGSARKAIIFGSRRTPWQDISFATRELVEMALRALSPGINDPFTAVACLDRLGAAFRRMAQRKTAPPYHYDDGGHLRLIRRATEFDELMENCFAPIRQFGNEHISVMLATFSAVATVHRHAIRAQDRAACREQAERTWVACQHGLWQQNDLDRCEAAWRECLTGE